MPRGCGLLSADAALLDEAVALAAQSDVAIVVLGYSQAIEGEEGQEEGLPEGVRSQGDRTSLDLPEAQEALLRAIHQTGTPTVLVLLNGSAIALNWAEKHVPAIVEAWYPGEAGGTAIADVLFGDINPAGRLPVTFYRSVDDLPPFADYAMQGRTYRYFVGDPLYPFGFGLSYTTFEYGSITTSAATLSHEDMLELSVDVSNRGVRAGDEVTQGVHPCRPRWLPVVPACRLSARLPGAWRDTRADLPPADVCLRACYRRRPTCTGAGPVHHLCRRRPARMVRRCEVSCRYCDQ